MGEAKGPVSADGCPDRLEQLRAFTDSGEAPEEFLAHLDECRSCQAQVDKALDTQARALAEFARGLMAGGESAGSDRGPRFADRVLKVLWACSLIVLCLLTTEMAVWSYAQERDWDIGQATRTRVEVLFPGVLDRECTADPGPLCHFGEESSACAAMDRYLWLPFPAPTKVLCRFDTWPQPHPAYGAAFIIVDGPEIVSYRYPNCPDGHTRAVITLEGGQPRVRQFPEADAAADECGIGPRIEVDRWRRNPAK